MILDLLPNLPNHVKNPNTNLYLEPSVRYLVLDFETTNLDKGDPLNPENRVVSYAISDFGHTPESALAVAGSIERLLKDVAKTGFLVAHNAKFELGWLQRLGADLTKIVVFDTMLAEYVLLGQHTLSGDTSLDLDSCLLRRGLSPKKGLVSTLIKGGVCPSQIDSGWLLEYGEQDVRQTLELFHLQKRELQELGLLPVFYTKCLQVPVLVDIESKGMCLDPERVREKYRDANEKLNEINPRLAELTGGINPNSPKQVAEFLFDTLGFDEPTDPRGNPIRTATGKRSASKDVIAKLTPRTDAQRRFIELEKEQSKLQSSISKYLEKFDQCCTEAQGILHATINQAVTVTGRYSSNGKRYKCQFQNFDRTFKPLFKARNRGWFLGEADEAQLEFRVAVFLGDDRQGRQDIADRIDVHSYTKEIITNAGQPIDRQTAKIHTFKPLYGGTSGTQAEKAYYDAFKSKYRGLAEWQDNLVTEALNNKKIRLPTGLILYFPDIRYTRSGYIEHNQKVRNYPVQYLATAEIVPIALVYAWHLLKLAKAQTFIVNTIHDSIISEVHPKEIGLWRDIMDWALIKAPVLYMQQVYNLDFDVPLDVELKLGQHWGEQYD